MAFDPESEVHMLLCRLSYSFVLKNHFILVRIIHFKHLAKNASISFYSTHVISLLLQSAQMAFTDTKHSPVS